MAVDVEVVLVADAAGVEGHGIDLMARRCGEDIGEPPRVAVGRRIGSRPAQGVMLVGPLARPGLPSDIGGSRVEDGILVGEIEIAAVAPAGAPAVLDDPGPVCCGPVEGVEVLPPIAVVPADDGDGVVRSADGETVDVAGGDEGGAGGRVEVGGILPPPSQGIGSVDAGREGTVFGEGRLDVGHAGRLVAAVAVVVEVVDLSQPSGRGSRGGGDRPVGGVVLVDGSRAPGQEGDGPEVVTADVHQVLEVQLAGGDVQKARQGGRLVDVAEVAQVHFGVVGVGEARPQSRRLQRGQSREGPAGTVGSLIADGRDPPRVAQVETGRKGPAAPPFLLEVGEAGQVAQVDGRGGSSPLDGSGGAFDFLAVSFGQKIDEGRVQGSKGCGQSGRDRTQDQGSEEEERDDKAGTTHHEHSLSIEQDPSGSSNLR